MDRLDRPRRPRNSKPIDRGVLIHAPPSGVDTYFSIRTNLESQYSASRGAGPRRGAPDDQRAAGGAGGELEALEQLESESDVVMVLIGDADIIVRRSFLLDLLDGDEMVDARDVVPELTDLAKARGMRVTFLPG
jgi:hypothetical protein